MNLDRNGLEVLDLLTSLELLGSKPIGRVVVSMDALPAALPVNFALLNGDIVFRTGVGSKLSAALDNAVVAFEVDDFEADTCEGWSVLVTGHSEEITDPRELERARRLPLAPWVPTVPSRFVRIRSQLVSGRRVSLDGRVSYRGSDPARSRKFLADALRLEATEALPVLSQAG
jgi:hypothetical protein